MSDIKTFTFFESYYEAAHMLPAEDRRLLYEAIIEYAMSGKVIDLDGAAGAVFIAIKPVIEKSRKRSQNSIKKQNGVDQNELQNHNNQQTNQKLATNGTKTKRKQITDKQETNASLGKEKEKEMEMDKENIPPIPPEGVGVGSLSESPPDPFEEFWRIYPRKVGKEAARKAWKKAKPSQALKRRILDAVEAAKRSVEWLKDNGQYIPHPATWLNQGRWDDELMPYEPEPPRWQPPNYDDEDDFIALLEREKAKEKTKDG